jgi:FKBP-type peptidyl-prolyl cis-trans isomerase
MLLKCSAVLLAMLLPAACHNKPTGSVVADSHAPKEDKEAPFVEGNKRIIQLENEEMCLFISRYHWNMQQTGSGLYIEILDPGKGDLFEEGDEITMSYKTFLLDGELIYDSEHDGLKQFKVAKSPEIEALHEAVQMLRPGAAARIVTPSYLAYGVAGDGDKVNGRMPLAVIFKIEASL